MPLALQGLLIVVLGHLSASEVRAIRCLFEISGCICWRLTMAVGVLIVTYIIQVELSLLLVVYSLNNLSILLLLNSHLHSVVLLLISLTSLISYDKNL